MAIDAHSTTAPADHRAKLPPSGNLPPSILGAVPVPTPALTAETVAMLDAIPVDVPHGGAGGFCATVAQTAVADVARALHMRRGAPERHPSCYQFAWCDATSSQEHWGDGSTRHDEAEAVNEDGGDILDDGEETLGWSANVGQLALGQTTADGDATALERHGRGFLRSGPDDAEDDDPAGAQQRDEDALFWSVDVGCAIGATVDRDGAHV